MFAAVQLSGCGYYRMICITLSVFLALTYVFKDKYNTYYTIYLYFLLCVMFDCIYLEHS